MKNFSLRRQRLHLFTPIYTYLIMKGYKKNPLVLAVPADRLRILGLCPLFMEKIQVAVKPSSSIVYLGTAGSRI